MEYRDYLYREGYAKSTIESYTRYQKFFVRWCKQKGFCLSEMDYKSSLAYVKKLRKEKPTKSTVKHIVGALKIYFNFLIETEQRFDNPMQNINIRGVSRTLNHNLLAYDELEDLYYSYQTERIEFPHCPSVAMRNKVITGLVVYQGLNATALKSLKYEHINIDKGTIYIPSTRKTNSRTLELKSQQMMPLLRYIEKHREILQEKIHCYSQALFPIQNDRFYITDTLIKELKRFNYKVKNLKQIRASVLTYWLSHYNIREVQYMSGHRYISSTERYVQDDLESLQEVIEKLHPIS